MEVAFGNGSQEIHGVTHVLTKKHGIYMFFKIYFQSQKQKFK